MRTLARFEFALGRRVAWGSDGHQIHIAPHAFAEANAFYSREDRGLFFGYFASKRGKPVFTCLAHDVIAHETTHAILDGLRSRYLEPSSPDQAAFHEGFADVVALLSVFSLPDVVGSLLDGSGNEKLIADARLERDALKTSILFGLADEMGEEISQIRGQALRRSVELEPGKPYMSMAEFDEPHERGELLVAAIMNAFLEGYQGTDRRHAALYFCPRIDARGGEHANHSEAALFRQRAASTIGISWRDNVKNASAVKNLMTMAKNVYVHAGSKSGLERVLRGVKVEVLGPPTVKQHEAVKGQRSKDPDE